MNELALGHGPANQTMSTKEIAEVCDKQHAHVIRDTRVMLEGLSDDPDLDHVREVKDSRGYTSEFLLPKNLSITLVSGYNVKLRKAIIDRWQQIEAKPVAFAIPQSYSEALRLAADNADRADKAEAALTEAQPKIEALDRLETSEGSFGPRIAAKMLDVPERKFTKWLEANHWAFRQNGIGPLQAYRDKRDRGYLEHRPHTFRDQVSGEDRTVVQMMITPKGLARLAVLLGKAQKDAA